MALDPSQISLIWEPHELDVGTQEHLGGRGQPCVYLLRRPQCPAPGWAQRSPNNVLCQLADNRFAWVDIKYMFVKPCVCRQLETGVWETEAGRGEGRRETEVGRGEEKGEGYAGCMTC